MIKKNSIGVSMGSGNYIYGRPISSVQTSLTSEKEAEGLILKLSENFGYLATTWSKTSKVWT